MSTAWHQNECTDKSDNRIHGGGYIAINKNRLSIKRIDLSSSAKKKEGIKMLSYYIFEFYFLNYLRTFK